MGTVRAGDIRQITINGRAFDPAPESSCTIASGGLSNEVALNGNGTLHTTQKRKVSGITDLSLSVDDTRKDLEFLKKIQDDGIAVSVTITLPSGIAYSGSLVLVAEELGKATGEGTATISLLGERFEQI